MRRNLQVQTLSQAGKRGYRWSGAVELAKSQIVCMTPGTATNDFATLPFRNLVGNYYYVKPEE